MLSMNSTQQKGETIVEVLIAIVVASSVLGGAYYLLNRSYRQNQASVERVAAVKAAESKVETLRQLSSDKLNQINSSTWCVNADIVQQSTECVVNNRYNVLISSSSMGDGKLKNYTIKTTWDSALGGQDNLVIYYRL